MGCKRPFEEMEVGELCFKHPRQLEVSDKTASFSKSFSCYNPTQDLFTIGNDEGGSCEFQLHEKVSDVKIPLLAGNDFVTSNPLSLVTDCEEDTRYGPFEGTSRRTRSPGFYDFDYPRRPFVPVDDDYSSSLNCSPKRNVPIGPNHQATIPIWRDDRDEAETLETKAVENLDDEELIMGTCVIPMPDSKIPEKESGDVGIGRAECCCLDVGSIRCVRQHVGERRESLRKSLGEKKFAILGFCDMGEEVSQGWSEEEELDFHQVVYSNPVSLGRKFWNGLSEAFPYRSKREIVSYYFNVFMLRKRASQNRSRALEIDSDDDEWHGSDRHRREAHESSSSSDNEEDSVIESLGGGESEDDDKSDDSGDDREHVPRLGPKSFMPKSDDSGKFDHSDHFRDDCFVFQDDSCMSFECQGNGSDSCGGPAEERIECPDSKPNPAPGVVDHLYLSDSLDSKVWDPRYYNISCPGKSFDILPWDMIQDIFGDGKDFSKTKDD